MQQCKWAMVFSAVAALVLSVAYFLSLAFEKTQARVCENSAIRMARSLKSYRDAHGGRLPPPFIRDKETGQRHGWRVILLPYVTDDFLYGTYDFRQPWNHPINRQIGNPRKGIPVTGYACAAHTYSSDMTNYIAVVGENTLWPEPEEPTDYEYTTVGADNVRWPAPQGNDVPPDGSAKIVLVELVRSNIPWMTPSDITLDEFIAAVEKNPEGEFFNSHVNGIRAIDASGQLTVIDPYDDSDSIRRRFLVADEEAASDSPTRGNADESAP
ncbi:MAG: DUF1559 domain-containing protein [Pirellulales bacterium]|nr:DUF1559 domain-containing protein [Pirellulales bacterium]